MKKIIFTLLGLLMVTSASAEESEYVPLVREGVVWEYVGHHFEDENENIILRPVLYTLEFDGTTTINGLLYHNIYRTDYDELGTAQEPYLVAYVREEDKIVTAIKNYEHYYWWDIPETLYDFNKPMFLPDDVDEFAELNYPISEYSMVDTYQEFEVEIGQTIRKGYQIIAYDAPDDPEYPWLSFKTIEGIGVDCNFGDLLIPYRDYITSINPMASLSAVYENGELVYKGRAYDEAQQLKEEFNAITNIAGDKQTVGVRYYNLAGVESAEPFKGVNLKVTTYTDGSRTTEKIIK